jgi:RNA polymerase sigma factor (sigma-70 family)
MTGVPATATAALLLAAATGDERAWNALVAQHTRLLWSVARSYRLDPVDAADAVQTTWLRLLEHLDRIEDPTRLVGWLVTTTRRECLRALRRSGRERLIADEDDALDIVDDDAEPVETRLLTNERNAVLWRAFRRLSDREQRLLRLLVATPEPYTAVAAALDVSVGSIGPLRQRALTRLRAYLYEEDPQATGAATGAHHATNPPPAAAQVTGSTKPSRPAISPRVAAASDDHRQAARRPDPATTHLLGHRPSNSDLTAQEERLLQRVHTGRTNAQIAEEFHLHIKTVEYHLHKIYRKLGIAGRTQLALATSRSLTSRQPSPAPRPCRGAGGAVKRSFRGRAGDPQARGRLAELLPQQGRSEEAAIWWGGTTRAIEHMP